MTAAPASGCRVQVFAFFAYRAYLRCCIKIQYIRGVKSLTVLRLLPVFVPENKVLLQVYPWRVPVGFPLPVADYAHKCIDLNEHLILNKEATLVFRGKGDSMTGIGMNEGDELLIDRSIEAGHGHIVIAVLSGEFIVKRLQSLGGVVKLVPENSRYPIVVLKDGQGLVVWGVVTRNLPKSFC